MRAASAINDRRERKLVLAVDDATDTLFLIGAALERAGFNFMGTASGRECLSLSLSIAPRLVLLDIEMPEMSGFEICKRLRANPDFTRVPIAFLTSRTAFEDVAEGLNAGGNDFIIKPIKLPLLVERAQHWTARVLGQ